MIPLATPDTSGNERKYLNECIDTNFVSSVGPFVDRFEDLIAKETGSARSAAVSSGTCALQISLVALGIKPNDLVILPSFTFIASANAIAHCHAMPWLMDIDLKTLTIDPKKLEEALESDTVKRGDEIFHRKSGHRVFAIMPVYTLGTPADMAELNRIAKKFNLFIVADGAAAIGAHHENGPLATLADLTTFSFNGNKTITCGGGGAVVGRNEEMIKKIKHLSTTARVGTDYIHDQIGYNYRLTNIQAAIGCAQVERLNEFVSKKREIRDYYNQALRQNASITSFSDPQFAKSACWFPAFIIETNDLSKIIKKLNDEKIGARNFWIPINHQPAYKEKSIARDCHVSDSIYKKILTLPCSTTITRSMQDRVIEILLQSLKDR